MASASGQVTITNFNFSQIAKFGSITHTGDYVNGFYDHSRTTLPGGGAADASGTATGVVHGGDAFGRSVAGQVVDMTYVPPSLDPAPTVSIRSTSGGTSAVASLTGGSGLVGVMSGDTLTAKNANQIGFKDTYDAYQSVQVVAAPSVGASNVSASLNIGAYAGNVLDLSVGAGATAMRGLVDFGYAGTSGYANSGMNGYSPASPFKDVVSLSGNLYASLNGNTPILIGTVSDSVTFAAGDATTQNLLSALDSLTVDTTGLTGTLAFDFSGSVNWTAYGLGGQALGSSQVGTFGQTGSFVIPSAVPGPAAAVVFGLAGAAALRKRRRSA